MPLEKNMESLPVDISVIIPTYNRIERLERCLASFLQMRSEGFRYELIVVDDGSERNPGDHLAKQYEALPLRWLRQSNKGPATARNVGAKAAIGKFVAFIDDDCLPDSEWLVYMVQALSSQPTMLVGGKTINGLSKNAYSEASQLLVSFLIDYFEKKDGRFFTSNNFGLSRQLFSQMGGFNETMPLAAGEDREFCYRWLQAGLPMSYEPKAIVYHFHGLNGRSYWRQHFTYGRGAHQFHQLKAANNRKDVQLEPLSFYGRLIQRPLVGKRPLKQKITLTLLMMMSQVANGAGYFYEKWRT